MGFKAITISMVVVLFFVIGCSSISRQDQGVFPKKENAMGTQNYSDNQVNNEEEQQSNSSKTSKKEYTNTEEYILKIFGDPGVREKNKVNIIRALEDINWGKYDSISQGKTMDLLLWLGSIEIIESKEISSILKATNGLDGAFAEEYADIITRRLFLKDKVKFVKCLSELEPNKRKEIYNLVSYNCGYFNEKEFKIIMDDTVKLLDSPDLFPKEKETVKELLKVLETKGINP